MERGWRIREFEWDEDNEDHIARHGVTPQEAEEVFASRIHVTRARRGRYAVYGTSGTGRYLLVFVERKESGAVRVVTARDMGEQERRLYLKRRK